LEPDILLICLPLQADGPIGVQLSELCDESPACLRVRLEREREETARLEVLNADSNWQLQQEIENLRQQLRRQQQQQQSGGLWSKLKSWFVFD
jgi:hypothetical protein